MMNECHETIEEAIIHEGRGHSIAGWRKVTAYVHGGEGTNGTNSEISTDLLYVKFQERKHQANLAGVMRLTKMLVELGGSDQLLAMGYAISGY